MGLLALLALPGPLRPTDDRLLESLNRHDQGSIADGAHLFLQFGEPLPQIVLLVAVFAIGFARSHRLEALIGAIVVGGADLTAQLAKRTISEHHYGTGPLPFPANEHTFPSGHTTTMTAMTFAFLLVVPSRLRLPVALVGAVLTVAVGTAMVILHRHWPSDVVGGVFVGCVWGFGAIAVLAARR